MRLCFSTLFIILTQFYALNYLIDAKSCNRNVHCIDLYKCNELTQLLEYCKKPLHPSIVQFLRMHQCGFTNQRPRICCSTIARELGRYMNSFSFYKQNVNKPRATHRPRRKLNKYVELGNSWSNLNTFQFGYELRNGGGININISKTVAQIR